MIEMLTATSDIQLQKVPCHEVALPMKQCGCLNGAITGLFTTSSAKPKKKGWTFRSLNE
jgi:hypothetical protein